jgi:hypothetical protein
MSAIRAVLDHPSPRRSGSVADFLAAAGLSFAATAGPVMGRASNEASSRRPSWRRVLLVAAPIMIGALVAALPMALPQWREAFAELQERGMAVLETVATPMATPAPPAETIDVDEGVDGGASDAPAAQTAARAPTSGPDEEGDGSAQSSPAAVQPAPESPQENEPASEPGGPPPSAVPSAPPPAEQTVLSMRVPRVAVREDHGVAVIEIVRSGDTTQPVSVGWWAEPGTAKPDEDYATGQRQVINFPAGSSVQRVLIPLVDDRLREPDEVFTVHLSPPRKSVVGDVAATRVTVYDDD